jgi:hypothetical protein
MKIFYGAAIQGNQDRKKRQDIHRGLIGRIKKLGCTVLSEHVGGADYQETERLLTTALGYLPPKGIERTRYVRDKMIAFVESDIAGCVFEVSVPSLGTGVEIAHAYLRPRMGLSALPILALYEKDFWPHGVSSMVRGIPPDGYPAFRLQEYSTLAEACACIDEFISMLGSPG